MMMVMMMMILLMDPAIEEKTLELHVLGFASWPHC